MGTAMNRTAATKLFFPEKFEKDRLLWTSKRKKEAEVDKIILDMKRKIAAELSDQKKD